jgi:hypothetical protein
VTLWSSSRANHIPFNRHLNNIELGRHGRSRSSVWHCMRLELVHRNVLIPAAISTNELSAINCSPEETAIGRKFCHAVTRISVLSTLLGGGKTTERLLVRISIETHKTSPDFNQTAADNAKNRIKQALGEIGCDVFIETDR